MTISLLCSRISPFEIPPGPERKHGLLELYLDALKGTGPYVYKSSDRNGILGYKKGPRNVDLTSSIPVQAD